MLQQPTGNTPNPSICFALSNKAISIFLFTFWLGTTIQAQNERLVRYQSNNPDPTKSSTDLILKDRFNNSYTAEELRLPIATTTMGVAAPTINQTCNAGMFKLHFIQEPVANYGFDSVKYRDVICEVFQDINRLLAAQNSSIVVHIFVGSDTSVPLYIPNLRLATGSDIAGTAFEAMKYNLKNVWLDNLIYTSIKLGSNSFNNQMGNTYASTFDIYHGALVVNFNGKSWYSNFSDTTSIPSTMDDLYTHTLRQALHMLGLNSNILSNGNARYGNNLYSRYDNFLYKNTSANKLLTYDTATRTINKTTALALGCGTNSTYFMGSSLTSQLVYNDTPFTDNVNLSHFTCSGTGICNATYAKPSNHFVLVPCLGSGQTYIKRHPHPNEVLALCDLGYKLRNIGGVYAYGNNTANNATAGNVYTTYSSCSETCVAVGGHDTVMMDSLRALTKTIASVLSNDMPTTSIIKRMELLDSNAGTLTYNATSFTFTPSATFKKGNVTIVYYPQCNGTAVIGSPTYITLIYPYPPVPPCNPDNNCNYICYGGFEESDDPYFWSDFNVYPAGTNNTPELVRSVNGLTCKKTLGSTYFDLCNSEAHPHCYWLLKGLVPPVGGEEQFYGMVAALDPVTNSLYSEGIHFPLKKPIYRDTTKTYKLSFWGMKRLSSCNGLSLTIAGDDTIPDKINTGKSLFNSALPPITCNKFCQVIGNATINSPIWQQYTVSIAQPPAGDSFTSIVIYTDVTSIPPEGIIYYAYMDNFVLYDSSEQGVTITSNPSNTMPCQDTTQTIAYYVCMKNGTATNTDSILLQATLPYGFSIASGSDFNANGRYTIPIGSISSTVCDTLYLKYTIDYTKVQYNKRYDINLGYTTNTLCDNTTADVVGIYPQNNAVSLSKAVSKANPNIGDTIIYNIQVCNNSFSQINNAVITDTLPNGLTLLNANGFAVNGRELSLTTFIDSAYSTGARCYTFSYSAIVHSNCKIVNRAYLSTPTNICFTAKDSATINASATNNPVIATITPDKAVWCGSNIPLKVTISNPSGTPTYQWYRNNTLLTGQTTSTHTANQNADYFVVIGNGGCSSTIQVPPFDTTFNITTTKNNTVCAVNNGSIALTPQNGVPPYTYLWNSGATTATRTGLGVGTYTVTITDSIGCTAIKSIQINNSNGLILSKTLTYPDCDSANGSIQLSTKNGITPYTYSWNTGATSNTVSGLVRGKYYVTVTDSIGCQLKDSISLQPFNVSVSISPRTIPNCSFGLHTLKATIRPTDSINSIDWYKDNTNLYYNDSFLNIYGGGVYKVEVDYRGCKYFDSVNIILPARLKPQLTTTHLPCVNSTGSITAGAEGGTPPYTYLWNNGSTATNRTGLGVGMYKVTITDALGCTTKDSVQLVVANRINAFISSKLNCTNNTILLTAIVGDGIAPITYNWSTGSTAQSFTVAATAATYTVTITDGSGCQVIATENTNTSSFLNLGSGVGKRFMYEVEPVDTCYEANDPTPYPCPNGTVKYVNGDRIQIGKNIRVYDTLELQEGAEFRYCDIILEAGATIIVGKYVDRNPSPQFGTEFVGCNIYTCGNTLARGIEIENGLGTWNSNQGAMVSMTNCVVEDCYSVVSSKYHGGAYLYNNYFKNNVVVVNALPDVDNVGKFFSVGGAGNTFEGSTSLKNMYSGFVTPPSENLPSITSSASHAAIRMCGNGSIVMGQTNEAKNVFLNLPYGIIANNEMVVVENSQFKNNTTGIHYTPNQTTSFNNLTVSGLGIGSGHLNTFENCPLGITATNCNFMDTLTKMSNVQRGIIYTSTSPYLVNISGNVLNTSNTAIHTTVAPNTELKIVDNEVNINSTDSATNGIEINCTGAAGTVTGSWVKDNVVTMNGTANFGIQNTNCNNLKFYCNTVNIPMPNTSCAVLGGIKFSGVSTGVIESNNTVTSDNIANRLKITNRQTTADTSNPYPFPVGIYYDNSSVRSNCNYVDNIRTGVRYTGTCTGSDVKRTQFNNHDIGLRLDNSVLMTAQNNKGNTFNGNCNQGARSFSTGTLPIYRIKNTNVGTNYEPNPILPTNTTPTYWWQSNMNNDTSCTVYGGGSGCTANPLPFSRPLPAYTDLQAQILSNTLEFDVYEEELIYRTKQELYFMLKPEEPSFPDSTAEKQFLALMDSTTALLSYYELHEQEVAMYPDYAFQTTCIGLQNAISIGQLELLRLDSLKWAYLDDPVLYPQLVLQYNAQYNSVQSNVRALDSLQLNQQQNNGEIIENLNEQNQSIVPLNIVDSIQSIFNELYYNTILSNNYNLTVVEKQAFAEFANTCPLLNPQAVYTSRGVVSLWDKSTYYNDAEICFQAGYAYKRAPNLFKKPIGTLTCILAPNPTKYSSQLQFSEIPKDKVQILVTDIQGRLMVIENKLLDRNVYEIDTKRYANGIYFVKVMMGKELVYSGKLEVLK